MCQVLVVMKTSLHVLHLRGADIDLADEENDTPLMIGAYEGHADVVRKLIELEARLDELNEVKANTVFSRNSFGNCTN